MEVFLKGKGLMTENHPDHHLHEILSNSFTKLLQENLVKELNRLFMFSLSTLLTTTTYILFLKTDFINTTQNRIEMSRISCSSIDHYGETNKMAVLIANIICS